MFSKTYTVIAEGPKACDKHPPLTDAEITVATRDIEFRGKITNSTDTTLSVLGYRNLVKRIRGKYKDVRTPCVLHFNREDLVDLTKGAYSGQHLV